MAATTSEVTTNSADTPLPSLVAATTASAETPVSATDAASRKVGLRNTRPVYTDNLHLSKPPQVDIAYLSY
jgi:hypothetical protein